MIDIIVAITFAYAAFKGYTSGFIVAFFSLIGVLIGLAAAMKLSVALADYFTANGMQGKWVTLLMVSWKMISPNGDVALKGMNVLLRNVGGQIVRDYILIGSVE